MNGTPYKEIVEEDLIVAKDPLTCLPAKEFRYKYILDKGTDIDYGLDRQSWQLPHLWWDRVVSDFNTAYAHLNEVYRQSNRLDRAGRLSDGFVEINHRQSQTSC